MFVPAYLRPASLLQIARRRAEPTRCGHNRANVGMFVHGMPKNLKRCYGQGDLHFNACSWNQRLASRDGEGRKDRTKNSDAPVPAGSGQVARPEASGGTNIGHPEQNLIQKIRKLRPPADGCKGQIRKAKLPTPFSRRERNGPPSLQRLCHPPPSVQRLCHPPQSKV
jgi:hypothetical protein